MDQEVVTEHLATVVGYYSESFAGGGELRGYQGSKPYAIDSTKLEVSHGQVQGLVAITATIDEEATVANYPGTVVRITSRPCSHQHWAKSPRLIVAIAIIIVAVPIEDPL